MLSLWQRLGTLREELAVQTIGALLLISGALARIVLHGFI